MTAGKSCKISLDLFGAHGTIRAEVVGTKGDHYCVLFKETRTAGAVVLRKGKIAAVPRWAVSFEEEPRP